jgi:TRAP-type C4-dicarboxylate transport system substrate-binding protein
VRTRTRWLTAISMAAAIVGGCTNASGPAGSSDPGIKAGGKAGPIAITVADSQPYNRPSNLPLAEFKRQVEQLSGGSMTVTVLAQAVDDYSDAAVIDKVKQGTFQMAVVPARAWSDAGVTSLKALQAPFLFESDEHVAAVVNDAAITKDLFTGFEGSGVTGLTLFPESLRHLLSFGPPMLTPADVKGKTIRAISSVETTAIIEALGGTAVDPVGDAYQQGVDDGMIQGTDSGFPLSNGGPNQTATATGNVALYAKVMTLVINSALWTSLDDAQREVITSASDATRTWAIANQVKDADAATTFCAGGGTVVLADAAGVAAFRAAEVPVSAALEADAATKRVIDAIRAQATGASTTPVKACKPVISAGGDVSDTDQAVLDGVYRYEVTERYLLDHGLAASHARDESGVHTLTMSDGKFTDAWVNGVANGSCSGVFTIDGPRVTLRWTENCTGDTRATYERGGDVLHWSQVESLRPHDTDYDQKVNEAFWGVPYTRVGDAP